MVEAVHYMEIDWRDNVVKPFNEQLANNYPRLTRAITGCAAGCL